MLQYLNHHFRLAVPMLALTVAIVFALSLGGLIFEVTGAPQAPSSVVVRTLGDGLDEFSALMSASLGTLFSGIAQYGLLIAAIALVSTAITAVMAVRQVSLWVHGPGDIGALAHHIVQRGRHAIGLSATPVSWGVVHDAQSGHPIPLATVSLLDARGSVMASVVADATGRYGFHVPAHDIIGARAAAGIHVRKDGYYFADSKSLFNTRLTAAHLNIPMQQHPATNGQMHPAGALSRFVQSAAFWSGIVTLPVAYTSSPGLESAVLVGLFALSALIRAVGERGTTLITTR